jgi:muramoyltetrapeptide carboxypeptidase
MFKMICPPFLKKGDKIGIVASARKINREEITYSLDIINKHGFESVFTDSLFAEYNQFAGNDNHRADEIQKMLDDVSIKSIMFARGGYGSVRIIDKLDFAGFVANPCWLSGYSDITVFHSHVNRNFGIQTLHATMPINFATNDNKAIESLFEVLKGSGVEIEFEHHPLNRYGDTKGVVTGGNLSVLYSLLGSNSFPETNGKILFIEDLDEYLYHIDRMMMALKRAGKLENLSGLLVGGMTRMNDNEIPFGKTAEEIIMETVEEYDYPVYFGFPAGHVDNNTPLVMGREVSIAKNSSGNLVLLSPQLEL